MAARPASVIGNARGGAARLVAPAIVAAALAGCSTAGYYAQAIGGHGALLAAARPVDALLADAGTPAPLRERLRRAQAIRRFASQDLGLPDNASYASYADLGRGAAVWSVFAAPPLSLSLKSWCYPLFGCAAYRGYFARADADAFAARLRADGDDVNVAAVPAYSTLGWYADPLLNTFIGGGDAELARLLFHELAHQVVYAKDDTVFNESFATTVERAGVARWLAAQGDARASVAYAAAAARRAQFQALMLGARDALQAVYASATGDDAKRAGKRAVFARLQADYRALRDGPWGGYAGYDSYFAQDLNNAHVAGFGAYHALVPAFEALLARSGSLPAFYDAARHLARLDKRERDAALQALAQRGS